MKNNLFAVSLFAFVSIGAFAQLSAQSFFASAAGTYTFPEEDEWDSAVGGDLRLGMQVSENISIFGLFGYAQWDMASDVSGNTGPVSSYTAEGDADVYSVGVGADFLIPLADKLSAGISASVQKQFVDSDVNYTSDDPISPSGSTDISDGVAAFVGIDLLYALSGNVDLFAGAGYLFSLDDPTVSQFIGPDLFETKFEGWTLRAGLRF